MNRIGTRIAMTSVLLATSCNGSREKAWDERSTLTCTGDQHITLSDRHVRLDKGPVFAASGNCSLEVSNSDIEAPSVLVVSGSAHVVIRGGRLSASGQSIVASGNAQVVLQGTQVIGPIITSESARVTGAPELDRQPAAKDAQGALNVKWGAKACEGIAECYRDGFVGQASGRIVGELDAGGRVRDVQITGSPAEPRGCVESVMKAKSVAGYDGGPGGLVCEFAGTWAGGNEELDISGGFMR